MKFNKNKVTKALAYGVSIVALAGVTNAYASTQAEALTNDEIINAATREVSVESMLKYKEDGYTDAQTWLVDKVQMQSAQQNQVTYIIQNYGDYLQLDEIAQIQGIMEKQSVAKSINELKQYKTELDKWSQYGADKKQKALQEKKEAAERAEQEAQAAQLAAQQSTQVVTTQPVQQTQALVANATSNSSYSWSGSAKDFIVSKESGGNYNATNGRYYGAYQLDISYLNGDLSQENQDRVAEQYVQNRYGSWENAMSHWQSNGWY